MSRRLPHRLAVLLSVVVLASGCASTDHVDRVVIENETRYPLQVDLGDANAETWLPLTVATPNGETVTQRVADKGDVWIFRFAYGGVEAGRLRLDRSELEQTDWHVRVPEAFGEELVEQGVDPPSEAVVE